MTLCESLCPFPYVFASLCGTRMLARHTLGGTLREAASQKHHAPPPLPCLSQECGENARLPPSLFMFVSLVLKESRTK